MRSAQHHLTHYLAITQVHTGIELRIEDDSHNSVPNAIITLNDFKMVQKSDEAGLFYTIAMPGVYSLDIVAPGFEPVHKVCVTQ